MAARPNGSAGGETEEEEQTKEEGKKPKEDEQAEEEDKPAKTPVNAPDEPHSKPFQHIQRMVTICVEGGGELYVTQEVADFIINAGPDQVIAPHDGQFYSLSLRHANRGGYQVSWRPYNDNLWLDIWNNCWKKLVQATKRQKTDGDKRGACGTSPRTP